MKTTLELPDDLVREIKLRAVHRGQKLKETVAELLQKGLASDATPLQTAIIKTDPRTGLPVIATSRAVSPQEELTPERVAELLIRQEVAWHLEAH
jgi:hypothetical protein